MLLLGDCNDHLKDISDNSIDLLLTDPPYGIEFMGKDWDKALVSTETWKECFRVLKQGKLAFIMCSPRQDVLSRMIINLQDAGFRTNYTSIYWTFAQGFPKAANISKLIDKRGGAIQEENQRIQLARFIKQKKEEKGISYKDIDRHLGNSLNGGGLASHYTTEQSQPRIPTVKDWKKLKDILPELGNEWDWFIGEEEVKREILANKHRTTASQSNTSHEYGFGEKTEGWYNITKPATEEAKKMEGAYVGFQPKPAVEIILVVSKGKTLTWLDDCRIPYDQIPTNLTRHNRVRHETNIYNRGKGIAQCDLELNEKGRFPANLLVSSNIIDNGENYSRYFSIDSWWNKTFPFLIVPKASKGERNKGLDRYLTVKLLSSDLDEIVRCPEGLTAAVQLLRKVTSGTETMNFSIDESGENITAQFPKDTLSITLMEINKTIESKILDSLMLSLTKGFTLDAKSLTESIGSPVINAENLRNSILITTKGSTELVLGVSRAALKMLHTIREKGNWKEASNFHSTVKPLKLMSYLITMGSREGDLVLDPFCGSGTVCIAAHQLHRKWLGIEMNPEYAEIIKKRLADPLAQLKLSAFA